MRYASETAKPEKMHPQIENSCSCTHNNAALIREMRTYRRKC